MSRPRRTAVQKNIKATQGGGDTEWPLAPPSEADLPGGEYIVSFVDCIQIDYFGQQKVRLQFVTVEPRQYADMMVPLFATLAKPPSRRSKYYALWVKANDGVPSRNDRMTARVFRGYWKARLDWSVPKNGGHRMIQVTDLIERIAGR